MKFTAIIMAIAVVSTQAKDCTTVYEYKFAKDDTLCQNEILEKSLPPPEMFVCNSNSTSGTSTQMTCGVNDAVINYYSKVGCEDADEIIDTTSTPPKPTPAITFD